MNSKRPLQEKSFDYAVRIVQLARRIRAVEREFALADQILRSGTSIGANIAEADGASSAKDKRARLLISLKECQETLYWLRLLKANDLIAEEEFVPMMNDGMEIRRILYAVITRLETQT